MIAKIFLTTDENTDHTAYRRSLGFRPLSVVFVDLREMAVGHSLKDLQQGSRWIALAARSSGSQQLLRRSRRDYEQKSGNIQWWYHSHEKQKERKLCHSLSKPPTFNTVKHKCSSIIFRFHDSFQGLQFPSLLSGGFVGVDVLKSTRQSLLRSRSSASLPPALPTA